MPIGRHLIERMQQHRLPRRTVRLRLTVVYGAPFLASGAALLGFTYVLVRHATDDGVCVTARTNDTGTFACQITGERNAPNGLKYGQELPRILGGSGRGTPSALTAQELRAQARQLQ